MRLDSRTATARCVSFVHSFIRSFVLSFFRSFVRSFVRSYVTRSTHRMCTRSVTRISTRTVTAVSFPSCVVTHAGFSPRLARCAPPSVTGTSPAVRTYPFLCRLGWRWTWSRCVTEVLLREGTVELDGSFVFVLLFSSVYVSYSPLLGGWQPKLPFLFVTLFVTFLDTARTRRLLRVRFISSFVCTVQALDSRRKSSRNMCC